MRTSLLGTASAHMMLSAARERGVPPHRCLRGTGITPAVLDDAAGTMTMRQEVSLARNLMRELGDVPALGLEIGNRYRVTMYGAWGLGLLCSQTPRDAVSFALRFLDLSYVCCGISVSELGGELQFKITDQHLPEDVRDFFTERTVSALVRLLGDVVPGNGWLPRIGMTMPRPSPPSRYGDVLGAPVSFGRPATEIRVDSLVLERPMPLANELTLRQAEQQCRELLAGRSGQVTLTDRVREYVLRRLPDAPEMSSAAAALNVSERTLRRRLAMEGTSFSAIVDAARHSLAEDLLRQGLPSSQVARRLGYTSATAFTHAFKRWTGTAPRAFINGWGRPSSFLVV